MIKTLCSEQRIQELCSQLSWEKVVSWSRVAVASLRKLRLEYAAFTDVVLPFSAALTQVCCHL